MDDQNYHLAFLLRIYFLTESVKQERQLIEYDSPEDEIESTSKAVRKVSLDFSLSFLLSNER